MWKFYVSLFIVALIIILCIIDPKRLFKEEEPPVPKTKEELNRMLAECIAALESIGVPISKSICPDIVIIKSRAHLGECHYKGAPKNKKSGYDYVIALSIHTLANSEKSLRCTILHELIHTVPKGDGHKGNWKKWATYASEKLGFNIKYREGNETEHDWKLYYDSMRRADGERVQRDGARECKETTPRNTSFESALIIWCPKCGLEWENYASSRKYLKDLSRCPKCGSALRKSTPEEFVKVDFENI